MVPEAALDRALTSLEGVGIGDALGDMYFPRRDQLASHIRDSEVPLGNWVHTDDTEMAMAIVEVLIHCGTIDQDWLARRFAERFEADPSRGYGKGARRILTDVAAGLNWRDASAAAFGNSGSMGNGSAMRIAPLGAWFADDLERVRDEARASAVITHSHPEGQAGAIAVAVAAATAWQVRQQQSARPGDRIFAEVLEYTPPGKTFDGILHAMDLGDVDPREAGKLLGDGTLVTAPDTVPFVIWSSARNLASFETAMIDTINGSVDTDTTGAMVGGIVALYVGIDGIPEQWRKARERFRLLGYCDQGC